MINPRSHIRTNLKVLELLSHKDLKNSSVVDVGAGEGYFSKLVGDHIEDKYSLDPSRILTVCDLNPGSFKYGKVACDKVDINTGRLPYEDGTFDYVCSIEVVEHVENQFEYLRELYRIAGENGTAIVTTPNILNINSRLKYFYSGFWLLFDPLPITSSDPSDDHINPVSLYHLAYMLYKAGFKKVNLHFDRTKRSAVLLCLFFYPFIFLLWKKYDLRARMKEPEIYEENRFYFDNINRFHTLASRTIILEAIK